MVRMTLDLHAHWVPAELAAELRQRKRIPRIESDGRGGERLVMPVGALQFTADYSDLDARLAFMDRVGVERQLLSLPGLFGIDCLPAAESLPLTQGFNRLLAQACRKHPRRFWGLAALPLADPALAAAELRRARTEPGLLGAILPINAFVRLSEAEKLRPLLSIANEIGAHMFLHPGRRPDEASLPPPAPRDSDLARRALDVQTEVAEAMITLLLSDFLDAFPRVSLHVANLGGTFPAILERLDHTVRLRTPGAVLPSTRTRRVHVDCSSLGPIALEQAVRVYGAERIVVGTDCPIFSTEWTLQAIQDARLTGPGRRRILRENALELLAPHLPS